ncbi:MAG: serpin family protein [Ilumatobacter sp.]|uniref:serpin family protein n=1 Tax=Ilumatobacter sp. TaxID=1967498 RepID=UPI00262B53A2|nr:serpin family protein [Ilumatobacter sp.]MDJ0770902.1 serpin family protein [Ilumatobacter sp.]
MGHHARIIVPLVLALVAASCGSDDEGSGPGQQPGDTTAAPTGSTPDGSESDHSEPDSAGPDESDPDGSTEAIGLIAVPDRRPAAASPDVAGQAITAFGYDVLAASGQRVGAGDNMIVSPLSIAIALGMMEPGATGEAQQQLHDLLRIDDPTAWHASMSALEQDLEARQAELLVEGEPDEQDPGEFHANIANAAFLQPGYPFLATYLDTIGTNYGAVLEELDFAVDQAAAADRINEFIADATEDRITDLVHESDIEVDTVLALVNALLLCASWQNEFDADATADDEFARIDGSTITVPFMDGAGDVSGRGDGWVAATKRLVGNVSLQVVLPDEGRFDDVAARVDEVIDEYQRTATDGGRLVMPTFETRVNVELTDVLVDLGLTAPFELGNLLGIADDPRLVLDRALHETWLAIDETGIEAAAATVILMGAVSAPVTEPVPVVLDRPFVLRIVDDVSGATLFAGRIMDPSA